MVHLHNEILCSRKKKGAPTLCDSVDGTESIMLSEISQEVKYKYHMISPLTGTYSTKQTNKQNITKDTELENRLTETRGERGGNFRGKG